MLCWLQSAMVASRHLGLKLQSRTFLALKINHNVNTILTTHFCSKIFTIVKFDIDEHYEHTLFGIYL